MPDFFENNSLPEFNDNEKRILGFAWRSKGTTQPFIVKSTGLSQQTVSRLVNGLLEKGVLNQGESRTVGRRGPPSMSVSLAAEFCYTFGVAMMTDAVSVSLMDFSGRVLEYELHPMEFMSRKSVIEILRNTFASFISRQNIPDQKILGVGVGLSGYSLGGHGRYRTTPSLDDWGLIELDDVLSDALGYQVVSENDGNAAAVGEAYMGAGRAYKDFCYIFIAAGVGGGMVFNHELMRGSHGNAGEIGLIIPKKIYGHPNLELLRQLAVKDGIDVDSISSLLDEFDMEWPAVGQWITHSREPLSLMVSALAATHDPQAIIIGGRIPKALVKRIIPDIEIYDDIRVMQPRPLPRVIVSEVDGDACSIGAAVLPLMKRFFPRSDED